MKVCSRLAVREIRRRPGRAALVALLVAVTVGGITVADVAYRSHLLPSRSVLGHAVGVARTTFVGSGSDRPSASGELAELLRAVPPEVHAVGSFEARGVPMQRADDPTSGGLVLVVTGDFTDPMLRGASEVFAGRLPVADDEVALGRDAARLLGMSVGDRLEVRSPALTLQVVGIAERIDGNRSVVFAPGYPIDAFVKGFGEVHAYVDAIPATWGANGEGADGGLRVWLDVPAPARQPETGELVVLWLASALVLAVLGVVVAAAFAASGRRQLVVLGQLGAAGAGPEVGRRVLVRQGLVLSAIGSLVGVGAGLLAARWAGDTVLRDGRMGLHVGDLVAVVLTAVVAGGVASVVPARVLASAPVAAALAGRAPTGAVRPKQVRYGVVALVVGVALMALSAAAAQSPRDGRSTLFAAVALLGVGCALGGVCATAPALVAAWGRLVHGRGHRTRLAVRSMMRNRARSAALVAAVSAVGAVGIVGASAIERWGDQQRAGQWPAVLDAVSVVPQGAGPGDGIPPSVLRDVEREVPGIRWYALHTWSGPEGDRVLADDSGLEALGVPRSRWAEIRAAGHVTLARVAPDPGSFEAIVVPTLTMGVVDVVEAASLDLRLARTTYIGRSPQPLTDFQRTALNRANLSFFSGGLFADANADTPRYLVTWEYPNPSHQISPMAARWLLLAALLLVISTIVGMGLALWAAEGRQERDQLVALGATPRTIASMAAVRAWFVSVTGGLVALPLGAATLVIVAKVLGNGAPFPWITVEVILLGLPLAVSAGSMAASRIAQVVRPATGTSLSLD